MVRFETGEGFELAVRHSGKVGGFRLSGRRGREEEVRNVKDNHKGQAVGGGEWVVGKKVVGSRRIA